MADIEMTPEQLAFAREIVLAEQKAAEEKKAADELAQPNADLAEYERLKALDPQRAAYHRLAKAQSISRALQAREQKRGKK